MKQLATFFFSFLFLLPNLFGQEKSRKPVILIEEFVETDSLTINEISLQSGSEHPFIIEFKVYNVLWKRISKQPIFERGGILISLTVLPDNTSRQSEFELTSRPEDYYTIQSLKKEAKKRIYDTWDIIYRGDFDFDRFSKTMRYELIIKKGNQYYRNKSPLLVEFYEVMREPRLLPGVETVADINLAAQPYSPEQFSADIDKSRLEEDGRWAITRAESLIGKCFLMPSKLYEYWTRPYYLFDGPGYLSGVNRFTFDLTKGIVGGSYDFYFDPLYKEHYGKNTPDLENFKNLLKHNNIKFQEQEKDKKNTN